MRLSHIARGAASAERGRRLMELRGVTPNGHPLWQGWEVQPVVEYYPAYGSIFPLVERRTKPAVYGKAGRLGVTKPRAPSWSENEILRLRKFYPKSTKQEIMAAFPGRTYGAIAKAANSRGIVRTRTPVETGNALLDQILARAQKLALTNSDLDAIGRCKGYFAHRRWKSRPNEAIHCRVVHALGGKLRVRFA